MLVDQIFRQRQDQSEGVLRHRVLVGARREADGDAVLGRRRQVHRVVTDAGARDTAQLRVGGDDGGRVGFRAGDTGSTALQIGADFVLQELAAALLKDYFQAGFPQQVIVGGFETN